MNCNYLDHCRSKCQDKVKHARDQLGKYPRKKMKKDQDRPRELSDHSAGLTFAKVRRKKGRNIK